MKSSVFFLFYVLCFITPSISYGQAAEKIINVPEVIVRGKHSDYFSDDKTTIRLSEKSIEMYSQQSLGVLLTYESPALIRSYGSAGSLMSLSLHGTGANHSEVTWNGFPLNSPSTGQADLSLIPAGFMQSVGIVSGASGALYGSGTFGGLIELDNKPDWNNTFTAEASVSIGSFGTGGFYASLGTGGKKFQYSVSASDMKAANDFKYKDIYLPGSPENRLVNNRYDNKGVIQNVFFNIGKGNYIDAGIWLQEKSKELPPVMGSFAGTDALQKDKISRLYFNYNKNFINSSLIIKSAYLSDYLHYTDKAGETGEDYSVDSEIGTSRSMSGVEYLHFISPVLTAGAGGSYMHTQAETNNYFSKVSEDEFAFYGSIKLSVARMIMNVSVRQEFYEDTDPVLQYSAGFRIRAGKNIILRSNISNKFRRPTLNEKYWRPGGNPALKPERGWGGDISAGYEIADEKTGKKTSLLLSGYFQSVDNWIQWVMHDSLTPVGYKKVYARGGEAVLTFNRPFLNGYYVNTTLNYGLNISTISEVYGDDDLFPGHQLVYVPKNIARISIETGHKAIRAGFTGSYTGKRETVESADPWLRLPSYFLFDVFAGCSLQIKEVKTDILMRMENVLSTRYEVMRSYPMPGRAFYVTIIFGINKNQPL